MKSAPLRHSNNQKPMPPEIFTSYSREDQAQVFPIVDKLRERGFSIHTKVKWIQN